MQTFGVFADIDAMSHKRHSARGAPEQTRAVVGRRAAQCGDIVDLPERRHFKQGPQPGARRAANPRGLDAVDIDACRRRRPLAATAERASKSKGALPNGSETYDMLSGARAGHRYFDGISRSQRYAELLGRPGAERMDPEGLRGALLELLEGQRLPLTYRRVLESMLPATSHPDFGGLDGEDLRELVNRRVAERCVVVPQQESDVGSCSVAEGRSVDEGCEGYFEGQDDGLFEDGATGSAEAEEYGIHEVSDHAQGHMATAPRLDVGQPFEQALPKATLPTLLGSPRCTEQQLWRAEKRLLEEGILY